jgi:hypothetical protein
MSGNASYRAIPDPFFDAESKNDIRFGPQTSLSKAAHFYGPKKRYFGRFLLFLLFWTISLRRTDLLI